MHVWVSAHDGLCWTHGSGTSQATSPEPTPTEDEASVPAAGLVREMQMRREDEAEHGDPIGPLDWPRILPFAPAAVSDRLGWIGLEAAHCRAEPAFELHVPALIHHRLVCVARPPEALDLRYDGVKRHVPPPAGSIILVPAGSPVWGRSSGCKDELHIFLEAGVVARVAAEAFDLDPARVGFADQSHFAQHFKRLVGVTPRHFRTSASFSSKTASPSQNPTRASGTMESCSGRASCPELAQDAPRSTVREVPEKWAASSVMSLIGCAITGRLTGHGSFAPHRPDTTFIGVVEQPPGMECMTPHTRSDHGHCSSPPRTVRQESPMTTPRHRMDIPWIGAVRRSRWARCLETRRTWQHRHRERRQLRWLLQMDERLLQDIGLGRTYVA